MAFWIRFGPSARATRHACFNRAGSFFVSAFDEQTSGPLKVSTEFREATL